MGMAQRAQSSSTPVNIGYRIVLQACNPAQVRARGAVDTKVDFGDPLSRQPS